MVSYSDTPPKGVGGSYCGELKTHKYSLITVSDID